jgi:putative tryptophan/tyrosine transport system substrate-binding protein
MSGGLIQKLKSYYQQDRSFFLFSLVSLFVLFSTVGLLFWTFFHQPKVEDSYTIGYLQWNEDPLLKQNLEAFRNSFLEIDEGLSEVVFLETYDLHGDIANVEAALEHFNENDADLLFVQTDQLAVKVNSLKHFAPVIFSLVSYPKELGLVNNYQQSLNNFAGTRYWISPSEELDIIHRIDDEIQTITFLSESGSVASKAKRDEFIEANRIFQYTINLVEVSPEQNLTGLLESLSEESDLIYLGCDELFSLQNENTFFEISKKTGTPVMSCDSQLVKDRSLLSVAPDPNALGEIAGQLAYAALMGEAVETMPTLPSQVTFVSVNIDQFLALGYELTEEINLLIDQKY